MKLVIYKILPLCLLVLAIFYLFYQHKNLTRRLEIIESDFLYLKNKIEKREQETSFIRRDKTESFWEDDNFKEFQKIIIEYVNKNISKLVPEKSTMSGRWVVSDIEFLSPEVIKVIYEDGHEEGIIFFKIEKAYNSEIEIKPFY
jgi:hypothetical protein